MDNNEKTTLVKPRRDEAARLFRRYARLGLDRTALSVFDIYGRIRGVAKDEDVALRLLGVYDMMRLLAITDEESARAVRAVYFADRGRLPAKNQTSERILRFATENHLDERTVYRRLRAAKELYYRLIQQ